MSKPTCERCGGAGSYAICGKNNEAIQTQCERCAMTHAEQVRPLLECTGVDDHDEPVCFKCNRIIVAIDAALRAEREACAKVCEDNRNEQGDYIAALIRKVTP